MSQNTSIVLKTVLIGDSGVGKTSLLTREALNTFNEMHLATIGVDFKIKQYSVGEIKVKMQIWDTAGQQRFRTVTRSYYKGANAICICFSLNNRESFHNLAHWLGEIKLYPDPTQVIFLIGCKNDLECQIPTDQILVFAQKHGLQYLQTSGKTGEGVEQAFKRIVLCSTQKYLEKSIVSSCQNQSLDKKPVAVNQQNSQKRCC